MLSRVAARFNLVWLMRGARIGERMLDPREMPRVMLFYERVPRETAREMLERLRRDRDSMFDLKRADAPPEFTAAE